MSLFLNVAGLFTVAFFIVHRKLTITTACTEKHLREFLNGIVSRDFEVCLLILMDSSDIATPDGTGYFFF
jgi:hypothetical protein